MFFSTILLISGCSADNHSDKQAAKVNDKVLTHQQLDSLTSQDSNKKFLEEIKREWVEQEVLYKEAVNKGITDRKEFNRLMQQSKEQLAAALLLKDYFDENEIIYTESELRIFYENNKKDFRINEQSFATNLIQFNEEENAIAFRQNVFNSNWNNALIGLSDEDSVIISIQNKLLNEFDFPFKKYLRIAKTLEPGEISIVLEDNDNYSVLQLLEVVERNEVPAYNHIKGKVKELYLASKKKQLYKDYLESLYSKYNVEIN